MSSVGVLVDVEALAVADIAHADADECASLLGSMRRSRGWLDAVEARITSRLRALHDTTGSAPAADAHGRHAGVSAAEGKRKERRSKTIDDAPSFGDALAEGAIGAEHVDGLANATAKVDDDVRSQLLADEETLGGGGGVDDPGGVRPALPRPGPPAGA